MNHDKQSKLQILNCPQGKTPNQEQEQVKVSSVLKGDAQTQKMGNQAV